MGCKFREDAEGVGFLHDSLIYYFAGAVALHEYDGPRMPEWHETPDPDWREKLAGRLLESPQTWIEAAEFLGGAWSPRRNPTQHGDAAWPSRQTTDAMLKDVALRLITAAPQEGISRLLLNLLRGSGPHEDEVLQRIVQALGWHGGYIHEQPDRLIQEVYNYLRWLEREPGLCREFAEQHRFGVTSVAVLPNGRIVSGSYLGTVKLWDPVTGAMRTVKLLAAIKDLAVSLEGVFAVTGTRLVILAVEPCAPLPWEGSSSRGASINCGKCYAKIDPVVETRHIHQRVMEPKRTFPFSSFWFQCTAMSKLTKGWCMMQIRSKHRRGKFGGCCPLMARLARSSCR